MRRADLATTTIIATSQTAEESGHRSMSLRLPRPMHEAMKALATQRGSKAADFYVES